MTVRGGRYELLRPIASGGMATVHLGRALGAGGFERLVAVKVMHAHLAEEPEFGAMFLDEARLAARIRHPNVVGTIDIQQDEQGLFLVMEYVEGPSLQKILRALGKQQRGAPPLDVGLRIFVDALAGLHAAHELHGADGEPLHLVHRDVSPQNVLIGVDGVARLTDFGVARAGSRLQTTRAGVVKGKVCYMAPEQIRSEPIDRRTDVYAAGALLWEILTGQRLVKGDNDGAMMEKILRGQHPNPREVSPAVPEAVAAVAMRALSAAPEDRYPTAAAFSEALEAAAATEGITIATPRVLSQFVKDLGIERADVTAAGAPSSSSKSVGRPAPSSSPREHAVSAATAVPVAVNDSTHAPVLAPAHEGSPRKRGALRWVVAGACLLVAGGGWLLFTHGPLRISWGDPKAAPAAAGTASASPDAKTAAAPPVGGDAAHPAAQPEPPRSAVPPPADAPPAAQAPLAAASSVPSAAPTPAARPATAPRNDRRRPEASPTSFRPKDL